MKILFFILLFTQIGFAQTNLGSGLVIPLTVGNGGSGATTLTGLLKGNGTSAFTALTIPLSETNGGTNQSTYTTGNILYASASNTLSKLAIGATNSYLTVIGGVPAWTALATAQSTPSNPTGVATSTTQVMMGLAGSITPVGSGRIMIIISGDVLISAITTDGGGKLQIRYGTNTAPINGATLTGTAAGGLVTLRNNPGNVGTAEDTPFSLNAIISGLTPNTAYWIDLAFAQQTSANATSSPQNISISAFEF